MAVSSGTIQKGAERGQGGFDRGWDLLGESEFSEERRKGEKARAEAAGDFLRACPSAWSEWEKRVHCVS